MNPETNPKLALAANLPDGMSRSARAGDRNRITKLTNGTMLDIPNDRIYISINKIKKEENIMEKYTKEWKEKKGIWSQDHHGYSGDKIWKIHYIENGTEYSKGEYFSKKEAETAIKASSAAAALGSISTPKKAASSRENGKLGGRPKTKK